MSKVIWEQPDPPPPHKLVISPNTANQSLEIANLFIVVEGSKHYVIKEDIPALQLSAQGL